MNKEQLTKVRDALTEGCGWSEQILANYDEKYARHPATEAYREFIIDSQDKIIEALDILNRELAAPEQEPMYFGLTNDCTWLSITQEQYEKLKPEGRLKVYEAPPSRKWQSLTDEEMLPEIQKCANYYGYINKPMHLTAGAGFFGLARAIESALRKKNSGEQA